MEAVGGRLRTLRTRAGLTQEQLAERAELAKDAISRMERGVQAPRLDTLIKLADALGVSLPTLVDVDGTLEADALPPELADVLRRLREGSPALRRATVGAAVDFLQALLNAAEAEGGSA